MPNSSLRLRVVGEGEPPPRRGRGRRGPGLAVILVGLYAILFAAALWWMKSQASHDRGPAPAARGGEPAAAPSAGAADRAGLLAGKGLSPAARQEYAQRLASDRCDCGCDLTLRKCLEGEAKCARSADMAEERLKQLR
ncbi:MAG TPA: hypothetical protein VMR54_03820 [Thermoanaerobaculia bacterium]|nr:hypothetical protein [Thermoanaerobaculia bacterium]